MRWPNVTDTATAAVAGPDGIPAQAGTDATGLTGGGSRLPPTYGGARPLILLRMVANRLGTAMAVKRKPTRTMMTASTRRESGVSTGGKAASTRNRTPSGQRNHPDLPNSVIS